MKLPCVRSALRILLPALVLPPSVLVAAEALRPEGDAAVPASVVERVDVRGNRNLPRETVLHYVSTKAGDPFDEERLRADFRRLWDTGFFEDLILHVDDGVGGKIVTFQLDERQRVQIIDFRGGKALSRTTIEDELKKEEVGLKVDHFFDLRQARRTEAVIKRMLDEKGRPFAKVRHEVKPLGAGGAQVSFVIEDGARVRVKQIDFIGNEVASDRALRGAMKDTRQTGFWNLSWLRGKTVFTDEKWNGSETSPGDAVRLRDFYLNRGYVTAEISPPRVSYFDGQRGPFFRRRPARWAKLEIDVREGDRYRIGKVGFEGLTVFKEEGVRTLFKIQPGDVYKESRIKKGYKKLYDLYGARGYFQWTAATKRKVDAEKKLVDVTLAMEEDKRYQVGRIAFVGNDQTRDKVIRREVYLNEGDYFNTEALKLTVRRINQLGYFKQMESVPQIEPGTHGQDTLDVTFKVEEQNRNQFTFGAGVSGLEGTFVNASFQTTNLLGRGETATLAAQSGGRTKNYQLALTEPYFLDRPITLGGDVFFREIEYLSGETLVGFTQRNQGVAVTSGYPVSRFARMYTSYSYQIIDLFNIDKDSQKALLGSTSTTTGISAPTFASDFLKVGRRYESRVTPSWVRNTVDNPFTPRSGTKLTASLDFAGGPLAGTVNYTRPTLEAVGYKPVGRRMALGVRGQIGYVRPYGRTEEIPYYERYFLGGETQIRGYDVRTIAPLSRGTTKLLGGNKFVLFNAEYYYDVAGPLRVLLFFDAGEAYAEHESVRFLTWRSSMGAEARFVMPVLNVPFRLIYAYNANRERYEPRTAFKFAVGTTF